MQPFEWIAPLKEAVLLLYVAIFSGILYWVITTPSLQAHREIPLRDEEGQ